MRTIWGNETWENPRRTVFECNTEKREEEAQEMTIKVSIKQLAEVRG